MTHGETPAARVAVIAGGSRGIGRAVVLAEFRIRCKQILGGLTHEYYIAA